MSDNVNQFENFQSEIIGKPPSSITRFGISFMFIFVLILMFFAWRVDYSDMIVSKTIINSQNPTVNVTAEYNDVVKQIFMSNERKVKSGDNVILMKSDVHLTTINQLKFFLSKKEITNMPNQELYYSAMGSLRTDFQILVNNIHKHNLLKNDSINSLKIEQIISENESLTVQLNRLYTQSQLSIDRKNIFKSEYKRALVLLQKKLISKNKSDLAKSKFIESKISCNQIKLEISLVESLANKNKSQIDLLTLKNQELLMEVNNKILSQKQLLKDKINSWEIRHLIKAPISGKISIPNSIYTHKNITNDQELFSIIPEPKTLVGKIKIPELGSGKIHIGQDVKVKLDSFPFQEFGEIYGQVKSKSASIHESSIFIEIEIKQFNNVTKELTTSHGKQVKYLPNMQGTVEIITHKKNILSRVFENLRSNM